MIIEWCQIIFAFFAKANFHFTDLAIYRLACQMNQGEREWGTKMLPIFSQSGYCRNSAKRQAAARFRALGQRPDWPTTRLNFLNYAGFDLNIRRIYVQ